MLSYKKIGFFIFCFLLSASFLNAQQETATSTVYVESWKANKKISEEVLNFNLNSTEKPNPEYIRDASLNFYKLTLVRVPSDNDTYDFEHWAVQLQQVLSKPGKKEKLGCNLLAVETCGSGGDNFPKENSVGILFPAETPKNSLEKIYFGFYYPISAKRVIKVQNFYVLIQVRNYKMNDINPKKLDSMDVTIEFKNEYKTEKGI